jgi:hypothetical protein
MAGYTDFPLYDCFFDKCLVCGLPVLEKRFGAARARDATPISANLCEHSCLKIYEDIVG